MAIRRVVTGQDVDRRSCVVSDGDIQPMVPPLLGGNEIFEVWGADSRPQLPTDGRVPPQYGYFAPPDGYRFGFFSMPPRSYKPTPPEDAAHALAETDRLVPGMTAAISDNEGSHATDTVDFVYIVSGQVRLQLDSGDQRLLHAGDCVVQNGTMHSWHNPSEHEKCLILVVFVGADRSP